MGIGGEIQIADGEVMVAMTPAIHSSSVFNPQNWSQRAGASVWRESGRVCYCGEKWPNDLSLWRHRVFQGHGRRSARVIRSTSRCLKHRWPYGMEPKMAASRARSVRTKVAHSAALWNLSRNRAKRRRLRCRAQRLRIGFYEMKPGETISFRGKQFIKSQVALPRSAEFKNGTRGVLRARDI